MHVGNTRRVASKRTYFNGRHSYREALKLGATDSSHSAVVLVTISQISLSSILQYPVLGLIVERTNLHTYGIPELVHSRKIDSCFHTSLMILKVLGAGVIQNLIEHHQILSLVDG
jgi:hypothetical protein